MTNATTAARRVAALTLIPTSVAVFGAGLAWANGHDPYAGSSSKSGTASQTPDDQLVAAQAKVDDAQAKLAKLQAEVDARNADQANQAAAAASASSGAQPAAGAATTAAGTKATAQAKAAAVAKATVAAPVVVAAPAAPKVQTVTKASTKP
jgi:hypothetical protein